MCSELVVAVVMEAFDVRRGNDPPDRFLFRFTLLDRAVHPLDLAIGPWMVGLGQPVLDPVCIADHVEAHRTGVDGIPVPRLLCELNAVIGEGWC